MFSSSVNLVNLAGNGCKAIHVWSCTDNISKLLEEMKNLTESELLVGDFMGNSALHYAAAASSYRVAEFLMTFYYNNIMKNIFGLSPVHLAAQMGDIEMLSILKKSKQMINDLTYSGWSALHFAVYSNHIKAVRYLIELDSSSLNQLVIGIDKSLSPFPVQDYIYKSPLDIAKIKGFKDISDYLESINALSSLHAAVATHNLQAITYYLSDNERKKELLNFKFGKYQITPMHIAAALGDAQACYCLLHSGASPSLTDLKGFSPLDAAVSSQSRTTVRVLLAVSDKVSLKRAAFLAASLNNEEICLDLARNDLKNEIDPNGGDSLLIRLIKRGFIRAAETLIKTGSDLRGTNKFGATVLHIAAKTNATKIISQIFQLPDGPILLNSLDIYNRTPLMYAILNFSSEAAKQLIEYGADVDVQDRFGMTPFALTTSLGNIIPNVSPEIYSELYTVDFAGFLASLAVEESKVMLPPYGILGETEQTSRSFTIAADIVLDSVTKAANQFPLLNKGTIIHIAIIMHSNPQILQAIMLPARHLTETPDGNGYFPIHLAAIVKSLDTLDLLLRANTNIKVVDHDGNNILHFLTDDSLISQVKYIYNNYPVLPNYANKEGDLPIHIACRNNAYNIVCEHVENSKNSDFLSYKNKNGETPADCAIKVGAISSLNYLYGRCVSNPLISSVLSGDKETVIKMLDAGISIESTDSDMMTPLHHAAEKGHLEMVELLLERGADRNALSKSGFSPLHYGAKSENKDVCVAIATMPLQCVFAEFKFQPFVMAENRELKKFLFRLWKRNLLSVELSDILVNYIDSLKASIAFINITKQSLGNNAPDEVFTDFLAAADSFLTIINRFDKFVHYPNVFALSIHHGFMQFSSFSCTKFVNTLVQKIADLLSIQPTKQTSNNVRNKVIFAFLDFLHIISLTGKYVQKIHQFPIPEFDNKILVDRIANIIMKECEIATESLGRLRSTILFLLKMPADIQGHPLFVSSAYITDISYCPDELFNEDYTKCFQRVFNTRAAMPRTIPFLSHQKIHIIAISDIFFFVNPSKTFAIPRPLIYARALNNVNNVLVSTPVGSFRIKFADEQRNGIDFLRILNTRTIQGPIVLTGLSALEEKKEKIFHCIAAYQVPTRKAMTVRMMTIKAGSIDACYDIASTFIKDTDTSQYLSITVTSREICDNTMMIL